MILANHTRRALTVRALAIQIANLTNKRRVALSPEPNARCVESLSLIGKQIFQTLS
ncbi:hypothetical protein IH601_09025 [Candidatus Bipolaricaulota bacterium]|nr:hypothetical protein [Candidatus Bipolaricaulota bacterium]